MFLFCYHFGLNRLSDDITMLRELSSRSIVMTVHVSPDLGLESAGEADDEEGEKEDELL